MQTKIGILKLIKPRDIKELSGNGKEYFAFWGTVAKPIVISNDRPQIGEECISSRYPNQILKFGSFENSYEDECRKIIVLPDQFSPEAIKAIANNELKDGDQVEVETKMAYKKGNIGLDFDIVTKLNPDGTATIHPHKKSIEQAAKNYKDPEVEYGENNYIASMHSGYFYERLRKAFIAGAKWQEENN